MSKIMTVSLDGVVISTIENRYNIRNVLTGQCLVWIYWINYLMVLGNISM